MLTTKPSERVASTEPPKPATSTEPPKGDSVTQHPTVATDSPEQVIVETDKEKDPELSDEACNDENQVKNTRALLTES